jgi:phage-related protein
LAAAYLLSARGSERSTLARLADAVYILHAFQKKTQAISKHDLEIAKSRYAERMRGPR